MVHQQSHLSRHDKLPAIFYSVLQKYHTISSSKDQRMDENQNWMISQPTTSLYADTAGLEQGALHYIREVSKATIQSNFWTFYTEVVTH